MLTHTHVEGAPAFSRSAALDKRKRAHTVWLLVLCMAAHGLTFTAIQILLPLIRFDLAISFTDAGILPPAATLSYALGQIPAGSPKPTASCCAGLFSSGS